MIVAIGVDLCAVDRIRRALEAPTGVRFRTRVFTPAEQAYCEARRRARFASYAARFAAKEAAMKALGTGWSAGVGWRDFEVVRAPGAAPQLVLHGKAAALARRRGMVRWLVTLSHDRGGAVASVIVEGRSGVTAASASAAERRRDGAGRSGRRRPTGRR